MSFIENLRFYSTFDLVSGRMILRNEQLLSSTTSKARRESSSFSQSCLDTPPAYTHVDDVEELKVR